MNQTRLTHFNHQKTDKKESLSFSFDYYYAITTCHREKTQLNKN